MTQLIGYARVSTREQNLDAQIDALNAAGCARIYSEKVSGAKAARPELAAAFDYMRPGDTLVVTKLDRLARTTAQLIETVNQLADDGKHFRCLDRDLDTSGASGKLIFNIFASFAEFERDVIRERTKAGLEAAIARGRKGGRPKAISEHDIPVARALLKDPEISVREAAKRLGVSPSTLYRHFPDGKRTA